MKFKQYVCATNDCLSSGKYHEFAKTENENIKKHEVAQIPETGIAAFNPTSYYGNYHFYKFLC